jgi:nucleoside-diphosphate-sugar epimerase
MHERSGYRQPPAYAAVRQADIRHSLADISAVRDALGFRPTMDLEEGLRKTVDWYRKAFHASPRIAGTISLSANSVPA